LAVALPQTLLWELTELTQTPKGRGGKERRKKGSKRKGQEEGSGRKGEESEIPTDLLK